MSQQTNPNDFLMGGGVKSFKFETTGQVAKGPILELAMQQQRDFKTSVPKFWDDGNPMMQLRVVIQTDEREPGTDDDGQRALYLKGEAQKAVRDAIRTAGAKQIEVGGTLALQYIGDGEARGNLNPPKLFKAEYKAPVAQPQAVSADSLI